VPLRFDILEVSKLRTHEGTERGLLDRIREEIRRDGLIKRPILVAEEELVILDGHHRYLALRELGCRKVPVYLIDYASDEVQLTTWPGSPVREITKGMVLEHARSGKPFPPKTTRHIVKVPLEDHPVPLRELL